MSKELAERESVQIQIVDFKNAKQAMLAFDKFKAEVLNENDFYVLPNDRDKKKHVRKSGWMKYAMALGITTQVYDERSESIKFNGKEVLAFYFTAKAIAPNGRFAEAVGAATSDEGRTWAQTVHGIRAMAQTRAVERAISNLVGGGEVGAEEMDSKATDADFEVKKEPPAFKPRRFDSPNPPPNGNEQEPIGLWQAIFKEAGFTEKEVSDNVEFEILDNYRIAIHQKAAYLKEDLWKRFMQVVSDQRGVWNKDKRQWEGPC